jgi:hypothetical protein
MKETNPGGGCYLNKAYYLEPEWEKFFWGWLEPILGLLKLKKRYDPTHLFDCWKCVGRRGPHE